MTPIWWLLGFIPALVLLYFLKLKRQERVISSTLLWRRSLEDLHVNAPFQRLRRSILFLLQLLAISLLILALWRVRCDSTVPGGRSLIVFLDVSASMKAREDGGTRLDRAKAEVESLLSGMTSTDRMTLLTFAARSVTVQPMTGDRVLLASRLDAIEATDLGTDLGRALETAVSIGESHPAAEIWIVGDGAYSLDRELPLEVRRLPFRFLGRGTPRENVGIVEADVRKSYTDDPRTEAFALLENSGRAPSRRTLSLYFEDQLVDAREATLAPGATAPVIFDVSALQFGLLRLELNAGDDFAVDDRAWLELSPPGIIDVFVVGEENRWIDYALRSDESISYRRVSAEDLRSPEMIERLSSPRPPVLVFDRFSPIDPPLVPAIFIRVHPALPEGVKEPEMLDAPRILDWDRVHPVLRDLSFETVRVQRSLVFDADVTDRLNTLVEADRGTIIGTFSRPGGAAPVPTIVVGFDILESNWPLGHYSFPVFFSNAVRWLGDRQGAGRARVRTGEPLVRAPTGAEPGAEWAFSRPDGTSQPAAVERDGSLVHGTTDQVGIYTLTASGVEVARFGVGLLDARESQLTPRESIDLEEVQVVVEESLADGSRDLWPWFALGALALLVGEWYVYHRRTYL